MAETQDNCELNMSDSHTIDNTKPVQETAEGKYTELSENSENNEVGDDDY